MTNSELENLKKIGCEVDYNPVFLSDEGYFDCLYTISYKGIFVGSDQSTYEFVCNQIMNIKG